jgi:DNA mismatch repair protein MutS2
MQSAALRALEFDRIREALSREALTPLGRERALALEPSADVAEIAARLALTGEAVAWLKAGGSLALDAADDLPGVLSTLDIEAHALEGLQLLALARFLDSVHDVAEAVRRADAAPGAIGGSPYPRLAAIAAGAAAFDDEIHAIRRAIEPSGEVADQASPALKDIRERLRLLRARLRSSLEAMIRGRDTAKYLQDQIISDRNGRYVLVVRAEHREALPGIVHGSSASGASLYLEPLPTVEVNNEIVGLAEREQEEMLRIRLALTDAFRLRADDLGAALDAAADFDEAGAKARFARRVDGVAPALTCDGRVEFRGARHPLLIPAVRDLVDDAGRRFPPAPHSEDDARRPLNPVAADLLIVPPARALVISGPNTGGKTVALKAVGLLALMAQAGLLIPAEAGSGFTPFRSIFADIGDEQSISASLSTFSGHIATLVATDRALELPALVLLDEVGGGTDPAEGGALGAAVIDHFRRRGALVIATTHDDVLKSYAATTEGATTAAFGFNPETYAPTYRLIYGAPGRSLAFEIAERLGMPAGVIADARARRSGRESQLSAHLARVDDQLAALGHERTLAAREREDLAAVRQQLLDRETRLAEREAVLKKRLDDKLNEKLRDARVEVDRIVSQLKQKAEALTEPAEGRATSLAPRLSTGDLGSLRTQARAALSAIGEQIEGGDAAPVDAGLLDAPPTIGQRVLVTTFGAEGIVRGISGRDIDVEIRGKRMRVRQDGLRRITGSTGSTRSAKSAKSTRSADAPGPGLPVATRELVLIGSTVDEAIGRAEKFLDQALLADEKRLRIVHGHGTGRLREALRTFFRGHPLVESAVPAPDNEGGDGATIVELKD